jgi:molybdopterin molybdotransferase
VEFLTSITSAEALALIESFPLGGQHKTDVNLNEATGRILATNIVASENIPPFRRSLVDGYAVKAKDTYGARETSPALLVHSGEVRVGQSTTVVVGNGQAVYVATGAMVPEGADAILMQEYVRKTSDNSQDVEATKGLRVGENICFMGEDVSAGQIIFEKGRKLTPFDMGVLSALGITHVPAVSKPLVGLISSGDEIVNPDTTPPHGKVRDINTYTISSLLSAHGCDVRFAGIAKDSLDEISEKLTSLNDCNLILLSGGSSKGQSDFVTSAIEHLGGQILFHGLNIKPGKPTIFGRLWDKPVFGLPGHPVSCAMVVVKFVLPLVKRLSGIRSSNLFNSIKGILTTNIPSSYGIEEYVRVTVHREEGQLSVSPVFAKSSVISMLSAADGYIVVEEGTEGLEAGVEVEVYSFA